MAESETVQDDTLIIIPARRASVRLPNKPLAQIAGRAMILHVAERAVAAGIGPVVLAVDDPEVATVLTAAGYHAVMTATDHPSGSDRIFEALQIFDPDGRYRHVVNMQGDLPTIDPSIVSAAARLLDDPKVEIGTLAAPISSEAEAVDPNVVKIVATPLSERRLRALYFTRATAPHGEGPLLHHIGLYAYRREALQRFVALPPSTLEQRERLEQLRALEDGMRIDVAIVDDVPFGVDTAEHLAEARRRLEKAGRS